jgi:hypothetical protein
MTVDAGVDWSDKVVEAAKKKAVELVAPVIPCIHTYIHSFMHTFEQCEVRIKRELSLALALVLRTHACTRAHTNTLAYLNSQGIDGKGTTKRHVVSTIMHTYTWHEMKRFQFGLG